MTARDGGICFGDLSLTVGWVVCQIPLHASVPEAVRIVACLCQMHLHAIVPEAVRMTRHRSLFTCVACMFSCACIPFMLLHDYFVCCMTVFTRVHDCVHALHDCLHMCRMIVFTFIHDCVHALHDCRSIFTRVA